MYKTLLVKNESHVNLTRSKLDISVPKQIKGNFSEANMVLKALIKFFRVYNI